MQIINSDSYYSEFSKKIKLISEKYDDLEYEKIKKHFNDYDFTYLDSLDRDKRIADSGYINLLGQLKDIASSIMKKKNLDRELMERRKIYKRFLENSGIPKKIFQYKISGCTKEYKTIIDEYTKNYKKYEILGAGAIFCGGFGSGKSISLGLLAREIIIQVAKYTEYDILLTQNDPVRYVSAMHLVQSFSDYSMKGKIEFLKKVRFLFIDNFDFDCMGVNTGSFAEFLDSRYSNLKSTFFASIIPPKDITGTDNLYSSKYGNILERFRDKNQFTIIGSTNKSRR